MKNLIFILFAVALFGCKKSDTIMPQVPTTWISGKWMRTKRVTVYDQYNVTHKDSSTVANELNFINQYNSTSTETGSQINPYFLKSIEGDYIDFNGKHWIISKVSDTKFTLSGQVVLFGIPYNYTDTYIKE